MNIFIVTVGSRGDVQPFVALGRGLRAAGHQVTLATSASFEPFVREHGLNYGYLNNQLLDLMDTAEGRQAMEETVGVLGSLKSMVRLTQEGNRINRLLLQEAWQAAQPARPDLVIYHPKALAGPHIAEKCGARAVLAVLQPMIVPTGQVAPIGIPPLRLGGWYNRMAYGLVRMGYSSYRGMVNEFRTQTLGLAGLPASADMLAQVAGQPVMALHAFSRHVLPRPADWPPQAHVTGYWLLDSPQPWQPPAALTRFLEAGPPPVYVGFGSMAGRDPQRLGRIVIEALQQAGVRGLLATGWGGLAAAGLPDSIFQIEQAPHDWLFARVAAVIHHGGAGTTAAGLRAGQPTIICPFMGDQPFWGQRVQELGAGSRPIPQKQLSAAALAAAIRQVTGDPAIRRSAAALGEQIRQEDGVANAVALLAAA